jgi:hypothetical protein
VHLQLGPVLADGLERAEVADRDVRPAVGADAEPVGRVVGPRAASVASVLMPRTSTSDRSATPSPVSSVYFSKTGGCRTYKSFPSAQTPRG